MHGSVRDTVPGKNRRHDGEPMQRGPKTSRMQMGPKCLDAADAAIQADRNRGFSMRPGRPCVPRLDRLQLLENFPALEQLHRFLQLDILL